jgi:hypothetical protein
VLPFFFLTVKLIKIPTKKELLWDGCWLAFNAIILGGVKIGRQPISGERK